MPRLPIFFLGCTLVFGGCQSAPGPVQVTVSARSAPSDYDAILSSHTRRVHFYEGLEDRIHVRATLHSPAFKQAFAANRARFQGRAAEEVERRLFHRPKKRAPLEQLADVIEPFAASPTKRHPAEQTVSFFVALYVADQKHRSLVDDDSIWDIALQADDTTPIRPLEIQQLRRTPSLEQVYPYLDKLDRCYWITFDQRDAEGRLWLQEARRVRLRFWSKLADAQLTWQLDH